MTIEIILRPTEERDQEFLFEVYKSVRLDEVSQFGWDELQQHAFLQMQFDARRRAYQMQFPAAEYCIILFNQEQAGQLIVERTTDQISIIDIAVLPQYQRKGVASRIIGELQDESGATKLPVLLKVDKTNQIARHVYQKHGFEVIGETDILYIMEWFKITDQDGS